ncbi:MAG TPA: replication factor C small subunit [Candidatus Norongarragalinales archaeon]|nr:replication factor C small subunit [Candidatus Norongarragalinales archaeon]
MSEDHKKEIEFEPWVEKYRPKKLKDVIGHEAIAKRMEAYVKSKNLPHLLLVGPPGSGKTTVALAMAHELFGDHVRESFIELNSSDERGIDIIRGKVKDFARTLPLTEIPFKVILLDEADNLTDDAQHALRRTMERYSFNTRFILSGNYSSRIIEPIQSRTAVFRFSLLKEEELREIIQRVAKGEGLHVEKAAEDAIIYLSEGDARKAVNMLQGAAALSTKISEAEIYRVSSRARPEEVRKMVQLAYEGKFSEARKQLDQLMINYGMSGEDVISQVFREVASLDVPDKKKVELVDKIGEYDFRIVEGASERIQLEALLAQIALLGKD